MDFNEMLRRMQNTKNPDPKTFDQADNIMRQLSGRLDEVEGFVSSFINTAANGLSQLETVVDDLLVKADNLLDKTQERLDERRHAAGADKMEPVDDEKVSETVDNLINDIFKKDTQKPVTPLEKLNWLVDNSEPFKDTWGHYNQEERQFHLDKEGGWRSALLSKMFDRLYDIKNK